MLALDKISMKTIQSCKRQVIVTMAFFFLTSMLSAEEAAKRTIGILPATDITGLNLELPLQTALVKLFEDNPSLKVQYSSFVLPGFTATDLKKAFDSVGSEIISFAYLETTRIAIFLFDKKHPTEFMVATEPFGDTSQPSELNTDLIEAAFIRGFQSLLEQFAKGTFQPLPGVVAETEAPTEEIDEAKKRMIETKKLYRELTLLQEGPFFAGGSVGMTNLRTEEAGVSSSNVSFGAMGGYKFSGGTVAMLGMQWSSYSFVNADLGYHFTVADKYVSFGATAGLAYFLTRIAKTSSGVIEGDVTGKTVFGPGLWLDIPLIGTNVRVDLRYYFGSSPMLLTTYGVVFTL